MLSEQAVDKLEDLIQNHGGADAAELRGALEDVGRLIGSQALLIQKQRKLLAAHQFVIGTTNDLLSQNSLENLLSNLNPPKRNTFTMAEARQATEQLVAKVDSATSFAEILKGVVQVAKVFI